LRLYELSTHASKRRLEASASLCRQRNKRRSTVARARSAHQADPMQPREKLAGGRLIHSELDSDVGEGNEVFRMRRKREEESLLLDGQVSGAAGRLDGRIEYAKCLPDACEEGKWLSLHAESVHRRYVPAPLLRSTK
jgi:hypothetical protein